MQAVKERRQGGPPQTQAQNPDRHPEARAISAFTRVFDALWRASKGDGPGRSSFEARAKCLISGEPEIRCAGTSG